jgi:hypothetical protein
MFPHINNMLLLAFLVLLVAPLGQLVAGKCTKTKDTTFLSQLHLITIDDLPKKTKFNLYAVRWQAENDMGFFGSLLARRRSSNLPCCIKGTVVRSIHPYFERLSNFFVLT